MHGWHGGWLVPHRRSSNSSSSTNHRTTTTSANISISHCCCCLKVFRLVIETFKGRIAFGVDDLCWYLDSTFCSRFHKLKEHYDPTTVNTVRNYC